MASSALDFNNFYSSQAVFLTGGTGGLGGCILYKLAVELPTRKIYVLVRSKSKAEQTWRKFMPNHVDAILNSGKVVLVTGDISKSNFGIEEDLLLQIASDATVVINSAANTSFSSSIAQAVNDNCFSVLELARIASSFINLANFIQVSTAYCNSFLPDCTISETIYPIYDPETELQTILTTGTSPHASLFPWAYAHSKHLSEQLLLSRFPQLPILIVRPACIGSAIFSPFPGYGPIKSMPLEMMYRVLTLNPGSLIFHATQGSDSGTNILDEIPVDWVANLILLHAVANTKGVVHAVAESFVPRTFNQHLELYREPRDGIDIVYVQDMTVKQCPTPEFYKVLTRGWTFSGKRSRGFKAVKGQLSIDIDGVDLFVYDQGRTAKVRADIVACRKRGKRVTIAVTPARESRL